MSIKTPIDPWPLIQKRFPSSEYALLAEVRDKAGFYASRSADGVAMNLWPSRGLHVNGIEVKSFRGDWLSELKKPFKAENIYQFCDYWWLVAADENIVKLDEVPKTWGFMEIKNGKLRTVIEAPKLAPIPMDRHFIAALLKRATKGMIPYDSISDQLTKARENGIEQGENRCQSTRNEIAELRKILLDFEHASGIEINKWSFNTKKMGEAVRFIQSGGVASIQKDLEDLKWRAENISQNINTALETMNQVSLIPEEKQ